mmetsp:Transcript_62590/g.186522  ORF Transcript_62590/g.186522 Transcript_62590/m.186522 type:complete len:269 (-) Transcript_62590:204-1010(-)
MLPEAAAAVHMRARTLELRSEAPLQEPRAHADPEARLRALGLCDEHKPGLAEDRQRLLVGHVDVALVHQAHLHPRGPQLPHRVVRAVERVAVADHVAAVRPRLQQHVVPALLELVVAAEEGPPVLGQDLRHLAPRAVDEPEALVPEHGLHQLLHLLHVGREEELRGRVRLRLQPGVREKVVDAEVAHVVGHVVDTAVAEVAEHVAAVEARHRHLADDHLLEGRKGAEDALAAGVCKPEAGAGEEVATLHHSALHVDLRPLLPDALEAA